MNAFSNSFKTSKLIISASSKIPNFFKPQVKSIIILISGNLNIFVPESRFQTILVLCEEFPVIDDPITFCTIF